MQKKLDTWGPHLKDNGPLTLADVVFPVVFSRPTLELKGETIEIIQAAGQPNARTLWVPSPRALFLDPAPTPALRWLFADRYSPPPRGFAARMSPLTPD